MYWANHKIKFSSLPTSISEVKGTGTQQTARDGAGRTAAWLCARVKSQRKLLGRWELENFRSISGYVYTTQCNVVYKQHQFELKEQIQVWKAAYLEERSTLTELMFLISFLIPCVRINLL